MGEITFAVPQVREGGFYPNALEKGLRSERALSLTLAEMYVQGASTREAAAIVEQLCGSSVSSTQVSRASSLLDATLDAWRKRPLGEMVYLVLDARYEKVREDGQIRDAAVLIASGIGPDGIAVSWASRSRSPSRKSTSAASCRAWWPAGCAGCN